MSNRYTHNNNNNSNKQFNKPQRKFVPKNQPSTSTNPNPTLSGSLRQSNFQKSDAKSNSSSVAASGGASSSRVRMGENGEWVSSKGNFVKYLPQDEAVAAGLGADEGGLDPVESQRVVDLLNRELSRLLKLSPKQFWREVASDTSLHEFLDSFLQFRSRWYDFPHHGAQGIVAGVIVGEYDLSRRVFILLYRISSSRDPGARAVDSLSPKDHAVLLQERKLLDLTKLLDICSIYGHGNEDLTRLLVRNAVKAQPWIHDNLTSVLAHFLGIIKTMQQRCSSSLEVVTSSGSLGDHEASRLHSDFLGVMDFINDAIVSMDAFVSAYKPAAVFFSLPVETSNGNEELLTTLAELHDSLLPSLRQGFRSIQNGGDSEMVSSIAVSLKMLSTRLVNFGWKLLEVCYLSNEVFEAGLMVPVATKMFPAKVEDPCIRADILVQAFREINKIPQHIQMNQNRKTYLQNIENNFNVVSRLDNLQKTGWMIIDDEQFQYLSGIMAHTAKSIKEPFDQPNIVTSNKAEMDEDAAIVQSKISQIKDLFPDYGNGFLAACLEVYNQNPEEVIQRILEGTLHKDLLSLDTSLETLPPPKPALASSRNDKGKGKVLETSDNKGKGKVVETLDHHSSNKFTVPQEQQTPPASSSSTGRYVRKTNDDLRDNAILNAKDDKDPTKTAALISQYEYEDEYDDTFDDLILNVGESGMDDGETSGNKIGSNMGKETGSSSQNASNSKWGSRKKPQFYVKDGKNYSYKVEGAVAVANANEASLVNHAQRELIHGLGRGGNIPLGAVKKITETYDEQDNQSDVSEIEGRGNVANPRGRGRRGGRHRGGSYEQADQSGGSESEGRGNVGNQRGRGRRGGGGNHYRKDRAMNKHFPGLTGY